MTAKKIMYWITVLHLFSLGTIAAWVVRNILYQNNPLLAGIVVGVTVALMNITAHALYKAMFGRGLL